MPASASCLPVEDIGYEQSVSQAVVLEAALHGGLVVAYTAAVQSARSGQVTRRLVMQGLGRTVDWRLPSVSVF